MTEKNWLKWAISIEEEAGCDVEAGMVFNKKYFLHQGCFTGLAMPIEQQILETIRVLAPDEQQAVLKFAESLQGEKSSGLLASESSVDLASRGIGEAQAAELRSRLQTFAEDWNRPEMAAYDEL